MSAISGIPVRVEVGSCLISRRSRSPQRNIWKAIVDAISGSRITGLGDFRERILSLNLLVPQGIASDKAIPGEAPPRPRPLTRELEVPT
jgi:hypothetical protein